MATVGGPTFGFWYADFDEAEQERLAAALRRLARFRETSAKLTVDFRARQVCGMLSPKQLSGRCHETHTSSRKTTSS